MSLRVVPMTLRAARQYVNDVHRHHRAPQGGLFALGAEMNGVIVGCAIVGRPVARALDDGCSAEVTRLASDGTRNVCSLLYGAARRAARALGYRRLITYTLASESGVSLHAAGWVPVSRTSGGSWSRAGRERDDKHPTEPKVRWEAW